jgi:hypothetical protein
MTGFGASGTIGNYTRISASPPSCGKGDRGAPAQMAMFANRREAALPRRRLSIGLNHPRAARSWGSAAMKRLIELRPSRLGERRRVELPSTDLATSAAT